ncbi:MAG: zinc ribbon domain-containing protein [Gemmatimonadales bacterium]
MTTPSSCPACHAPLSPDARYCHRCGRAVTAGVGEQAPWFVAWGLVLVALAGITWFVVTKDARAAAPDMANAGNTTPGQGGAGGGGGAPPDISQMTPRERFLRLHDRIMNAVGSGDTATALRFAPMALQAYGMLDQVDADARYHAGVIHIQLGDYPAALALADTIQAEAPKHLFASLLRLEVGQASRDAAASDRARRAFLADFDQELRAGRPEYDEHRPMLDDLKQRLSTP